MPRAGVRYGMKLRVGLMISWRQSGSPPLMSPPIRLGFQASMSAQFMARRARTRLRKPGAKRSICTSMASVISTVEPCGTWQYAQAICFPGGARVGSNNVGCARRT